MKPFKFYMPAEDGNNCYIHNMFFTPIIAYLVENKIPHSIESGNLASIKDSTLFIMCMYLNKDTILMLKNNGNFICSFDANDSTTLFHHYFHIDEAKQIDLIMKFAGIQKTETSIETVIDNKVNYSLMDIPFATGNCKEVYKHFVDTNRIHPMPHVPWTANIKPPYVK